MLICSLILLETSFMALTCRWWCVQAPLGKASCSISDMCLLLENKAFILKICLRFQIIKRGKIWTLNSDRLGVLYLDFTITPVYLGHVAIGIRIHSLGSYRNELFYRELGYLDLLLGLALPRKQAMQQATGYADSQILEPCNLLMFQVILSSIL